MAATKAPRNRGHRNTNERGNTAQRRRRKQWMLDTFGDGESCQCHECGARLTKDNLFVDRIIPAYLGGTYARDNIRPHCGTCSCRQGARLRLVVKGLATDGVTV